MDRTLAIHSLRYRVRSNRDVSEWLDRLLTENELGPEIDASDVDLRIEHKDTENAHAIPWPTNAVLTRQTVCFAPCYYHDGRFVSRSTGIYEHTIECDIRSRRLRAIVGRGYENGNEQSVVVNIVRPLLHGAYMPFWGYASIHGALVLTGGKAVFLTGESGAGKTTIALRMALAGHEALSDDKTFLRFIGGRTLALSSLDTFFVRTNTLRLLPGADAHVVGPRLRRRKFAVSRAALMHGDAWRRPVAIDWIVELRRLDIAKPRIVEISRTALLQQLVRDALVDFATNVRDKESTFQEVDALVFDMMTSLVSQVRAVRIEYSNAHGSELPALLERLVLR